MSTVYRYATEDVVIAFKKQLDRAYGKGKWKIEGREYSDDWGTPPEKMKLEVVDKKSAARTLGSVQVKNKYNTVVFPDGPHLEAMPEKMEAFDKQGKHIDLFPKEHTITVTIDIKIEHSDELTAQEAIDLIAQEMDYDFNFNGDNARIIKTEMVETNKWEEDIEEEEEDDKH